MSATGFTPISLYYSSTPGSIPVNTNLVAGELALNTADGKLYFKNSSNVVTLLASSSTVAPVTTISFGTTGLTPATATSGAITVAGTLATTNGGTGLTAFTANGITYASSTSALATGSALTFDGTNFATTGSASAASLIPTGSSSPVNGIYLPTTNSVAISTNSLERLRLNASGVVNIQVNSTTTSQYLNFGNNTLAFAGIGGYYDSATTGHLEFYTATGGTSTEKMRIDNAGNVGIGLTPVASNGILQLSSYASIKALFETATISGSAPASTTNFDIITQAVQYYTSNTANNWTLNIRGNSGTTLDSILQTGQSVSLTVFATNSSTAYYNSAVQVDGTTSGVTTKWQGSAPTSGNASALDVYTYVVIKTGSATFTVIASQTKFA